MATADANVMAMWDALPSAGADVVRRSNSAAVADPEAWRRDGSVAALAEHIAHLAGWAYANKECTGVAGRILRECGGDVCEVNAAYQELETPKLQERHANIDSFFVRIALANPPGWQIRQVVAAVMRRRARGADEPPCEPGRADFSDAEWRRMLSINRRTIIARETQRDIEDVADDAEYRGVTGC